MSGLPFLPTHLLWVPGRSAAPVMACEPDGPDTVVYYTAAEWEAGVMADWERDTERGLTRCRSVVDGAFLTAYGARRGGR